MVVNNGAVIGAPGFGFATGADGKRVRVPHACPVELGDDCEIGANTTIDASHPAHPRRGHAEVRTRLGADVKVDNQVHIAHGCEIGEHTHGVRAVRARRQHDRRAATCTWPGARRRRDT